MPTQPGNVNADMIRRVAEAFNIDLARTTERERQKLCRLLALQWDEIERLLQK